MTWTNEYDLVPASPTLTRRALCLMAFLMCVGASLCIGGIVFVLGVV